MGGGSVARPAPTGFSGPTILGETLSTDPVRLRARGAKATTLALRPEHHYATLGVDVDRRAGTPTVHFDAIQLVLR